MTDDAGQTGFVKRLHEISSNLDDRRRGLALYAAAIALADSKAQNFLLSERARFGATREAFYEVVLQSYLFLGFPRMLSAVEQLAAVLPSESDPPKLEAVMPEEGRRWFEDGMNLCRGVYGRNYEALRGRVESWAPEIFRWMIIEGYGKVLSRPTLDIQTRELAIVATLVVENYLPQLLSHIKGAINVGVDLESVGSVVADLGPGIGPGYGAAMKILRQLERG